MEDEEEKEREGRRRDSWGLRRVGEEMGEGRKDEEKTLYRGRYRREGGGGEEGDMIEEGIVGDEEG